MEENRICYECGKQNKIVGYCTFISTINVNVGYIQPYNLDRSETIYMKYTKTKPDVMTNYSPVCEFCELSLILSRSKSLKNFNKCSKCECYSQIETNTEHLNSNIYKLQFNIYTNSFCFFFDNTHQIHDEIKLCNDCAYQIIEKNEVTQIINCKSCNKKIGKPCEWYHPCNNVIFITDNIFTVDCFDLKSYLKYKSYYEKSNKYLDNDGMDLQNQPICSKPMDLHLEHKNLDDTACIRDLNYNFNETVDDYIMQKKHNKIFYSAKLFESKGKFNVFDRVCIDCIERIGYEKKQCYVTCELCNAKYECEIGICTNSNTCTQGHNCASNVFDTCIKGFYGSTGYDTICVQFKNNKPSNLKYMSNVCDNCIDKLIQDNVCETPEF